MPRPVEDADVLPRPGLLALAFLLGGLAAGLLMYGCDRVAPSSSVLHGVGSRAFASLQALPPTIAEPSHG